eukprot:Rmarinus@m.220
MVTTEGIYAKSTAVAIRSIVDSFTQSIRNLRIFVIGVNLVDETILLLESLSPCVQLIRVHEAEKPRRLCFAGLKLLLPVYMPYDVDRIIYLDSDVLVRRCLGELWFSGWERTGVGSCPPVAVVRDFGYPHGPVAEKDGSFRSRYFNAGVMILSLDLWRDVSQQWDLDGIEALPLRDQCFLNEQFVHWTELDVRWNVQGLGTYLECCAPKLFSSEEHARLKEDPWIVHFTGKECVSLAEDFCRWHKPDYKPWLPMCVHPYRAEWRNVLEKIEALKGWKFVSDVSSVFSDLDKQYEDIKAEFSR